VYWSVSCPSAAEGRKAAKTITKKIKMFFVIKERYLYLIDKKNITAPWGKCLFCEIC
jgi:hypothetical protein